MSISRSVDRRRTGTIIRSVGRRRIGAIGIVIAGIAALSVVEWYVAVHCQRRVGSVGRSARSLVIGLVCRRIGARSYRVHRCIGIRLVGLCSYAYRHEACRVYTSLAAVASWLWLVKRVKLAEFPRAELA